MLKKKVIKICLGSSCFSRGNNELITLIQKFLRHHNLEDKVEFSGDHCNNECMQGPNIRIEGKIFQEVSVDTIDKILKDELRELI